MNRSHLALLTLGLAACGGVDPGAITPDVDPPEVPTLTATAGTTTIHVQWTEPFDDRGVDGYRLYRDGDLYWSGAALSYDDLGIPAHTRHCYEVLAYDAAGNPSGVSAEACATTVPDLALLSVARSGTGLGNVTSVPAGIACGETCGHTWAIGTAVTLTAAPGADSIFAGWTGCDQASGTTCELLLSTDRSVEAQFTARRTLTVVREELGGAAGTVTTSPAGISCGQDCSATWDAGTSVTLTATAASGSMFGWWSGCWKATKHVCALTLGSNATVRATFVPKLINGYRLTIRKDGRGAGTITWTLGAETVSCGPTCPEASVDVPPRSIVVLEASPGLGSSSASWSGCDSVNARTCEVRPSSDRTVTVTFGSKLLP